MSPQDPSPPPPPGGFSDPFAAADPTANVKSGKVGSGLDNSAPAVAAAPSRVFIVLGLVLAVATFMLFQIFVVKKTFDTDTSSDQIDITRPDAVPEIPDLSADITPPPPPTFIPPEIPQTQAPVIQPSNAGPSNELLRQRIRSSMLISGGGGVGGGLLPDLGGDKGDEAGDDNNLKFAGNVYRSNTKAQKTKATHIGDMRSVVAEGRMINAVLETAINTDLPGNLRAIVSRDVFPEAGNYRIIPKGSRLIGKYNSALFGGQKRVYVVWTRLIRPDGVDIIINSPLVDQIGQAGVAGQVDTKFTEIFSRAILTSVVTIAIGAAADELNGNSTRTTTTGNGSTTTTSDATTEAIIDSTQRLGRVTEGYLSRFINIQPTILVDQGTPVNVFVSRDLIFPAQFSGTRIVE